VKPKCANAVEGNHALGMLVGSVWVLMRQVHINGVICAKPAPVVPIALDVCREANANIVPPCRTVIALGASMIWWAYAGLSGSIVASFASTALLMGMPAEGVFLLTVQGLTGLLVAGLLVNVCVGALTRKSQPKQPKHSMLTPFEALLAQPLALAASKQPELPPAPPMKRPAAKARAGSARRELLQSPRCFLANGCRMIWTARAVSRQSRAYDWRIRRS
jgi:hypothetical protein